MKLPDILKANSGIKYNQIIFIIFFWIGLYLLSFRATQSDFNSIVIPYSLCFVGYLLISLNCRYNNKILLTLGIVTRVIIMFSFPNLSNDLYRYWWDGMLSAHGINPFEFTPAEVLNSDIINDVATAQIYNQLNSPDYHTVYPAVCQGLFYLAYTISKENIYFFSLALKVLVFFIEILGCQLTFPWLSQIFGEKKWAFIYLFNPLILIETYVNLHFELLQSTFLIVSIYALFKNKSVFSGIMFGLSVLTKLTPLIFIPLFLLNKKFNLTKFFLAAALILSFQIPLFLSKESSLNGYSLYFKQFEFNSSLFMILSKFLIYFKWPDLWNYRGFILMMVFIIAYSILLIKKRKSLEDPGQCLKLTFIIYGLFILVNSTVHPWYIIPFFIFGLFGFPLTATLGSYLCIFSYAFYDNAITQYFELIRILEYLLVLVCFGFEMKRKGIFIKPPYLRL